jgi:3-oxo-5-alpha-steroid 4-dehydrogenase 1
MSEEGFFNGLIVAWIVLAALTFVGLFFSVAPYGRHSRAGWGPTLPSRLGWLIMEAPAALLMAVFFLIGPYNRPPTAWVFLLMWEAHYIHRAFIYPWTLRERGRRMAVSVAAMAFFFNLVNGYMNGRYLFGLSGGYPAAWLLGVRFLAGLALFLTGFVINRWADRKLLKLRSDGGAGYSIPQGGLYRWISCPNYFGEIVEWFGWAVATWSPAGLTFALWTAANLAPRAYANHRWYQRTFPAYPARRRALLPGIW